LFQFLKFHLKIGTFETAKRPSQQDYFSAILSEKLSAKQYPNPDTSE